MFKIIWQKILAFIKGVRHLENSAASAKLYLMFENIVFKILKTVLFGRNKIESPKSVVIYTAANLGDTICRVPAMHKIKEQYPEAKLTLFTTPMSRNAVSAKVILDKTQWIDEIIVYYPDEVDSLGKAKRYFNQYKSRKFDLLINFPYVTYPIETGIKEFLWCKWMGVKAVAGFKSDLAPFAVKAQIQEKEIPSEAVRNMNLLPFKVFDYCPDYELGISAEAYEYVKELLKNEKINPNKALLLSFAGKGRAKYWSTESFREIINRWIDLGNIPVVIGGPGELEEAKNSFGDIEGCKILCGKTTLEQSFALIDIVGRVLTIDTGTAHQASAMNAKCITLMCARDVPGLWHPYGANNYTIRKKLPCAPCFCSKEGCPYGNPSKCMEAITVDEVWEKMMEVFS